MPRKVAIVGGGAIGLLCAYHLQKAGAEVVVIERGRLGAACSAGNAGWVTPAIALPVPSPALRRTGLVWLLRVDSPLYIKPGALPGLAPWLWQFWRACTPAAFERGAAALMRFAADAPELFRELARDGIEFECGDDGLLMVFHREAALKEEREFLARVGYEPVRELSGDEVCEHEPALGTGAPPVGALHILSEAWVRPESFCASVAARCRQLGVVFHEDATVDGLRFDGDVGSRRACSAEGPFGEIEADAFVIATGAEAGRLALQCGTRLPLQAGKGYSVTVRDPGVPIRHPLYLAEARVGLTPFADGHRAAGTMELSGINTKLDPRRLAAFRQAAERAIPGILDGASSESWVGMRPMTPDGLPVMGPLPSSANVFVSSGHQMLGITLAPASGQVLASMVLPDVSIPDSFDPEPFGPSRF